MPTINVRIECESCGGTGLYRGMAEPEGTAVVCLSCAGSGAAELSYTPFEKRKERTGITTVARSRGSFIATGVGPVGATVTYAEFQQGRLP